MPYMKVSITKTLTEDERVVLSQKLGDALGLIPGKHSSMLIADIEDSKQIYLGGTRQDNFAFVDVRYYSNFEYHIKKKFTAAVFDAIKSVLETTEDRMFLTITEFNTWGGFGNFVDERYGEQ